MNPIFATWLTRIPNQPSEQLQGLLLLLGITYALLGLLLSVYGFYSTILTLLYWVGERRRRGAPEPATPAEWPVVTVQLPIFNEYDMLERLVAAVAAFDYPADRLEVQVLDDSTDETVERARQLVEHHRTHGLDIRHLHRAQRTGFKAGALAAGLTQARGEFVAVFDADFIPAPDFLKRVLPHFTDAKIACVQSRWTHLNADYSLLTQAQALIIDGHFMIEKCVSAAHGLFVIFNGSGGIWRRAAIDASGGWQSDTITEDMDLSYRAQLLGYRVVFLDDVTVPSELPAQLDAWKRQQFRWAKGTLQTTGKLAGPILRSRLGWPVKVAAMLNMGVYAMQPLSLLMMLLTPLVALLQVPTSVLMSFGAIAALGAQTYFVTGQFVQPHRKMRRLWALPVVYLIGVGTALSNTFAVLEAIRGTPNVFERTPKFGIRSERDTWTKSRYALGRSKLAWAELAMFLYALSTMVLTAVQGLYQFVPWLIVPVLGFGMVAGLSFWQDWRRSRYERRDLSMVEDPAAKELLAP